MAADLGEKTLILNITMENQNDRPVYGVPMVYLSRLEGSVIPRKSELKAFRKKLLTPGEVCNIKINVNRDTFACWNGQMKYEAEPGKIRIEVKEGDLLLWSKEIKLQ